MISLAVWFILSLPALVEAGLDYFKEYLKGIADKKGLDVVIRLGGFIAAGVIVSLFTTQYWWQGAILSLGIYIMIFDYIMGTLIKKNPFYLGTTSWTDRLIGWMPWFTILILRGILFAATVQVYYQLDLIIGQ